MLVLKKMTEQEFVEYRDWMIEDYAMDLVRNFYLPMDEAREISRNDIQGSLRKGLETPNYYLYHVVNDTGSVQSHLGYLSIEVDVDKKSCYIHDIYLFEQYRNQGWGRKVLEWMETDIKKQGINRVNLNVFANNKIAQDLYLKMGYEFTNMHMQKWLGEPQDKTEKQ